MTPGARVRIVRPGLEYNGRKGTIDHLFDVDGDTLCAVRLDDGRVFGLPANWLKAQ